MTLVSTGSAAWKAVQIDGERATDKEFNFLTCFEEITAYDIGPGGKRKSRKTPKKKKELIKKGQITDQFSPSSEEGKKHKKKEAARKNDKKKTKPKKKMQKEAAVEKSTDQQPDHHDQSPTSSEKIPVTPKKTKKRSSLPTPSPKAKKTRKSDQASNQNSRDSPSPKVESSQEMEASDHDEAEDNADESAIPLLPGWDNLFVPNEVLKALKDLGFTRDETGKRENVGLRYSYSEGSLDREWDGSNGGEGQKGLKALILTPTRELAIQVKQHIAAILKYTTLRISCLVGGLSVEKQQRLLKKRPHILVPTPGRLWALLPQAGEDDGGGLKFLVIDETDRMVEKGHFQELTSILEYFKGNRDDESSSGRGRQTFVFSATLIYVHPPPRRLTSSQASSTDDSQRKNRADPGLHEFSIDAARRLHGLLNKLDVSPFMLHAKMHQKQRLKNLQKFIAGRESVLLATDVAARGLDIQGIEHVLHYQGEECDALAGMKRQVKGLEKELEYLLSQPLHGDGGTRTRYITSDIVKAEEEAPKNAVGLAGKEIEESAGVKKKSLGGRLKLKEKKKKGKKVPGKKNKPKKVFKRKKGKK